MFKKSIAVLLSALSFTAFASDFYVVVPMPGRKGVVAPVTTSLAAQTLPVGLVGDSYYYDFKPLLQIQSAYAYTAADITWVLSSGSLPAGVSLYPDGTIFGAPTAVGSAQFALTATYRGVAATQTYQFSSTVAPVVPTGAWSSSTGGTVAPTNDLTLFKPQAPLASKTRTVYLRNTGTTGAVAASFVLSGDTSHFTISNSLTKVSSNGSSGGSCGGTLAGDKLSTAVCTPDLAQTNGAYKHIRLQITYKPQATGSHQISLTPTAAAGASMPAPLVFKGSSADPIAAWSTTASSTIDPVATLDFGPQSPNSSSLTQNFYLRNISDAGLLAGYFTLVGDTEHFKFSAYPRKVSSGGSDGGTCGANLSLDGTTTSTCTAATTYYRHIKVSVVYAPKANGNHSVALVPTPSSDGPVFPADLVFTGVANSIATADWSTALNAAAPLDTTTLNFGSQTAGVTTKTNTYYLRNTSPTGAVSAAFGLTGDTSQFKFTTAPVRFASSASSCGSVLSADQAQASECLAVDAKEGGATHIKVQVTYAPTVAGTHSAVLTTTSATGTIVPAPVTLTGDAIVPLGEWSSTYGSTIAPTNTFFGNRTVAGTDGTQTYILRNGGVAGTLASSFQLTGDTSQFYITSSIVKYSSGGSTGGSCGGTLSADKLSTAVCTAERADGGYYKHMRITVAYAPTVAGNHSVSLTPVGSGAPPLVLTGSAAYNPAGVWSTSYGSNISPTTAYNTFAATTVGGSLAKAIILRNSGTNDKLTATFTLTGDTEHFYLTSGVKYSNGGGNGGSCGATLSGDKLTLSNCTADDVYDGAYKVMRLLFYYAPKSLGTHSMTLTATSETGATMPEPLVFTGTSK